MKSRQDDQEKSKKITRREPEQKEVKRSRAGSFREPPPDHQKSNVNPEDDDMEKLPGSPGKQKV
jgi:hypothetical protein